MYLIIGSIVFFMYKNSFDEKKDDPVRTILNFV